MKKGERNESCTSGGRSAREILHPFPEAINRSVRQPDGYLPAFFFCRPIRNPVRTSSRASPVRIRR